MTDTTTPGELLARLGEAFPDHAIKQRQGGGNRSLDYVAGDTVIRRLNAAATSWDFRIVNVDWRPFGADQLVTVTGELTIPGLGTRSGIGVQVIRERGGEDLIKGASTDALKKAATLFGVALELYGPDLEAGEAPRHPSQPGPRPNAADRPAGTGGGNGGGNGGAATERQRSFINTLATKAGMPFADLKAWCRDNGIHADSMTGQQASQVIDYLKPLAGWEERP